MVLKNICLLVINFTQYFTQYFCFIQYIDQVRKSINCGQCTLKLVKSVFVKNDVITLHNMQIVHLSLNKVVI